ncbi:MAG: DUF4350 domain-containing protein [Vicinamibacteraceae bacterium]
MRRPGGSRDLVVVLVAAALMLLVAGVTTVVAPPDEGLGLRGSSLSSGSWGAKAGFLLLRRLGYVAERTFDPIVALQANPATDVLVLMAPQVAPSDLDMVALTRFIEAGGVLIVAETPHWLPSLTRGAVRKSTATTPVPVAASPLALGAPSIRMDHLADDGEPRPPYTTIYADPRGAAVVAARVGRGRVIYWASALPATNSAIDEPGHVELLVNAIGPPRDRRVLWDEHYHGHRRSAWSYASGTPLPAALAQLAVIALAAIVTVSFRRRPLRAVPDPPRTAPLEFIDTMGSLYERAGATTTAVAVALAHLRRRLVVVSGLPADAGDASIARTAAARAGLSEESLAALLARARDASRGPLDAGTALSIVRALQEANRTVDRQARGAAIRH